MPLSAKLESSKSILVFPKVHIAKLELECGYAFVYLVVTEFLQERLPAIILFGRRGSVLNRDATSLILQPTLIVQPRPADAEYTHNDTLFVLVADRDRLSLRRRGR